MTTPRIKRITTYLRELEDGRGKKFNIKLEIDTGSVMDDEIVHLANKARSKKGKAATSGSGVLRLTIIDG